MLSSDKKYTNVTSIARSLCAKYKYKVIVKDILGGIDLIESTKSASFLSKKSLELINKLNAISGPITGSFLEYLTKCICCECYGIEYTDDIVLNMIPRSVAFQFPVSLSDAYMYVKLTGDCEQTAVEILYLSCSHALRFTSKINFDKIQQMVEVLETTTRLPYLIKDIKSMFKPIQSPSVSVGPVFGYFMPQYGCQIPSDGDLIVDDIIYEIKCVKKVNEIYNFLQILFYYSLSKSLPKDDGYDLNEGIVLNFYQGEYKRYNLSVFNAKCIERVVKLMKSNITEDFIHETLEDRIRKLNLNTRVGHSKTFSSNSDDEDEKIGHSDYLSELRDVPQNLDNGQIPFRPTGESDAISPDVTSSYDKIIRKFKLNHAMQNRQDTI